ncbi:MAG TPA: valine--tRNA ligase [Coriobacteriia bacterium]|nr:valine--tRNA ligase [Coriobacteriia bacterium]
MSEIEENELDKAALPKNYDPKEIEGPLFTSWFEAGGFGRDVAGFADAEKPSYTIVIPPPNITGVLHMGHALNNTLQDILTRKARMQGRPTRWVVGTDHAGIATQNKVEQKLAAEGKTRFDVGREAFLEACWQWRDKYGSTIIEQLKSMGCSCDYNQEKFTMDADYATAIRKVFVDWWGKGLVYKGHRIINWCPRCTTALADDEVEHQDEAGHLWHLRYPLVEPVGDIEYLVVATTRPETMLGDTGVAVSPDDDRYKALVEAGAQVRLPLMDRIIPVFTDDYVDAEFGTGAVKVTPAHDPNDFDMGQRHDLEQINIFTEEAVVNENGGRFAGLTREEAREAVVAALEDLGLLDTPEEHDHAVGHCYRCGTTIEPWLSDQWFVKMSELAAPAIEAVRTGEVVFHPKRWENVYYRWMENIRDWCISRQLWWGHRIPVFYCDTCGWVGASEEDLTVCPECGAALRQDEDVLDTWFSSQLWPFATQGWPSDAGWQAELAAYYPTQVLSTARDIIFLWVARMIMSSMNFLDGQVPFRDVIVHPTVLDKHGNIMSKSRGNGVDPLVLIDKYGADSMRFGLALQVTGAQDLKFDEEKIMTMARNFSTKVWNASRYVLMNLEDFDVAAVSDKETGRVTPEAVTDADRWILSRLARLTRELGEGREGYDFGVIARALYSFFWNEFCDWYIELSKSQLNLGSEERLAAQRNLVFVLDNALRMLHPFMPFITEKIWLSLPHGDDRPSLMVAEWPCGEDFADFIDERAECAVEQLCAVVGAVRATRARYGISPKHPLGVIVKTTGDDAATGSEMLFAQASQIESLARTASFTVSPSAEKPAHSSVTIASALEIYIVLEGLVDFDAERARLTKERDKKAVDLEKLNKKLNNEGFLAKADAAVIEKTREDAGELKISLEQLEQQLADLG